ncbi:splicing regulator SDE2 [Prorops nasuta]|uniref:splicing regulator SDE2 n=1 Tax=Prorops nasuta TaxID=863751 RepID=UPI0034CD892C
MVNVEINTGTATRPVFKNNFSLTTKEIWNFVEENVGLLKENFYLESNGRPIYDENVSLDGNVIIIPRLLGGKGGFGSMLRAIGAQIEKTTNREACRDLSGRRLRDINEEKRLKAWIEKQASREEEAAERKKRKLERLCAEPKHEFKDKNYEKERSVLTERVGDAVEEGFKAATSEAAEKVKIEATVKPARKTILDLDIDSDELDTSDDSGDEEPPSKMKKVEKVSDSGHSSDETDKNSKMAESEFSESSCDNTEKKTGTKKDIERNQDETVTEISEDSKK